MFHSVQQELLEPAVFWKLCPVLEMQGGVSCGYSSPVGEMAPKPIVLLLCGSASHSFNRYSLNTHSVPGTVLNFWDRQNWQSSWPHGTYMLLGVWQLLIALFYRGRNSLKKWFWIENWSCQKGELHEEGVFQTEGHQYKEGEGERWREKRSYDLFSFIYVIKTPLIWASWQLRLISLPCQLKCSAILFKLLTAC